MKKISKTDRDKFFDVFKALVESMGGKAAVFVVTTKSGEIYHFHDGDQISRAGLVEHIRTRVQMEMADSMRFKEKMEITND